MEFELKFCDSDIVPDLDVNSFCTEYYKAANLLKRNEFKRILPTLQKLHELCPGELTVMTSALAWVAAVKPHSADAERLISKCYLYFNYFVRNILFTKFDLFHTSYTQVYTTNSKTFNDLRYFKALFSITYILYYSNSILVAEKESFTTWQF